MRRLERQAVFLVQEYVSSSPAGENRPEGIEGPAEGQGTGSPLLI